MGGDATPYLIPAPYTGMSTYNAHRFHRTPPSSEPGVDYYMPTGTPLRAPTRCRVVEVGGSIYPATGRFVTVDDGTRWLRFLHLSEWRCKVGDELDAGEIFALSGASGYGSELFGQKTRNAAFWNNTGGDHVHVTAFRGRGYTFGRDGRGSVDFHALTGGRVAGGEDDDVSAKEVWNTTVHRPGEGDVKALQELADAKTYAGKAYAQLSPIKRDGKLVPMRQDLADTGTIARRIEAQVTALTAAVQSLATAQGADPKAIEAIVEKAVTDAMSKLSVTLDVDSAE